MRARKSIALLLFVSMFLSGCASYTPTLVKLDATGPNVVKQAKGDLLFLMEEYATDEKCKKAFDANLIEDGVLPLLITLQNNGQHLYEVKAMDIILRQGTDFKKAMTAEEAASKAKKNAVTRALGWSMIVPIISIPIAATVSALHTSKVNKQMATDFAAKSFTGGIIMPYKELSGFLFFQVEDKRNNLSDLSLEISARNTTTGESVTIASPLPQANFKAQEVATSDEERKE